MNANNESKQILKVSKHNVYNVYTRQTDTQYTYLHSEAIFVFHCAVSI